MKIFSAQYLPSYRISKPFILKSLLVNYPSRLRKIVLITYSFIFKNLIGNIRNNHPLLTVLEEEEFPLFI